MAQLSFGIPGWRGYDFEVIRILGREKYNVAKFADYETINHNQEYNQRTCPNPFFFLKKSLPHYILRIIFHISCP